MSKKKHLQKSSPGLRKRSTLKRRKSVLIIVLLLSLSVGGMLFAQWRSIRPTIPIPAPQAAPQLSKEYIYAGGKLIAIEEPVALPPPTNVVAATYSNARIDLTWTASTGAVDHYEVERSSSINGPYSQLTPNPTTNSLSDTTVTSGVAYLYRVYAVNATGGRSTPSNIDLATAITFANDPLPPFSIVYGQHILDLRQAVNAVRATAGLTAATWDDTNLGGVLIKAIHIQQLRTRLDEARSALGLAAITYTDPTLTVGGTEIKKAHLNELRQGVK